jgi:hypothetical protein
LALIPISPLCSVLFPNCTRAFPHDSSVVEVFR